MIEDQDDIDEDGPGTGLMTETDDALIEAGAGVIGALLAPGGGRLIQLGKALFGGNDERVRFATLLGLIEDQGRAVGRADQVEDAVAILQGEVRELYGDVDERMKRIEIDESVRPMRLAKLAEELVGSAVDYQSNMHRDALIGGAVYQLDRSVSTAIRRQRWDALRALRGDEIDLLVTIGDARLCISDRPSKALFRLPREVISRTLEGDRYIESSAWAAAELVMELPVPDSATLSAIAKKLVEGGLAHRDHFQVGAMNEQRFELHEPRTDGTTWVLSDLGLGILCAALGGTEEDEVVDPA